MFFASARGKSRPDWEAAVAAAEAKVADDGNPSEVREKAQKELSRLKKLEWQCDVYVKVRELAARLADWGVKRMPDLPRVSICTGGGPGAMQAANEGAASIEVCTATARTRTPCTRHCFIYLLRGSRLDASHRPADPDKFRV